jgi:prepilin-type N-terminal cleavage/methylation domain-containing protein
MNQLANQRGFTLIELVMVIALLAIITKIASVILSQGLGGYIAAKNITEADWQARLAMSRMTREIRMIRSANDFTLRTASELAFVDLNGTSIDYKLAGTSLMRNSQILADNISNLIFSYYDKNGNAASSTGATAYIQIQFTLLQTQANFNLSSVVYLRDYFS